MRELYWLTVVVLAVALAAHPHVASAQDTTATVAGRCNGEIITDIEIRTERPKYGAAAGVWRFVQNVAGRHHAATHPEVIASYLDVEVGKECTEYRRAETERKLRAQPFIAAASVRAQPDGAGGVRLEVNTVDEVPLILGGRFSGLSPEAIRFGDANLLGQGVRIEVSGERGHAYREGVGLEAVAHAAFGRPLALALILERRPRGSTVALDLTYPFYTDLQRSTWHAGYRQDHTYIGILRPALDELALSVRQTRWDVGGVLRGRILGQVVGIGAVLSGVRSVPADEGIVLSDSGFAADTGSALNGRYSRFRVTRPALIAALRLVRFDTARGFTTLTALEDLPEGLQIVGLVGRSIPSAGANDVFVAGSIYAGRVTRRTYLGLQAEVEARNDFDADRWDGVIVSGRVAWLGKRSPRRTLVLSNEFSGGYRSRLPLQLSLGSRDGGVRGYRGSYLAGARRNIIRAEYRWLLGTAFDRADFGVAGFADAGSLWAGSAPYGRTKIFSGSVGVSLLAAFPSESRRLLRLDVAVPATRTGNEGWELRFSTENRGRRFWSEPGDVARARAGPVPSNLFAWPVR
jgi:hypothetical protein